VDQHLFKPCILGGPLVGSFRRPLLKGIGHSVAVFDEFLDLGGGDIAESDQLFLNRPIGGHAEIDVDDRYSFRH
jgi:hypothetical protein